MKTFTKILIALLMIFTLNTPVGASASTENVTLEYLDIDELSSSDNYANGENPSITVLDNGLVVSVNDKDGKTSYQLGEYEDDQIFWTHPVEYGGGEKPTIATLTNGNIIEVHEGGNHELHYNLGRYEDGKIDWYSVNNYYGKGDHPNVTLLTNGDIVLVFEGQGVDNTSVYYEYGTFDNDEVSWHTNGIPYENGLQPSIAALDNGRSLKTHKSESDGHLWLSTNKVVDPHLIWRIGETEKYEPHNSNNPVMLQLDNGYILSMFDSNQSNGTWNRMGEVSSNGQEVEWTTNTYHQFDGKNNDVVQLQNGRLLNVHEDHESDEIRYKLGSYDEEENRVDWRDNPLEYLDINEVSTDINYHRGERYIDVLSPSITVLDNGLVLAVSYTNHEVSGSKDLWYQLGEYYDYQMYWTDPVQYDTGHRPSVATLPNGEILEVHDNHGNLYFNRGKFENGEIDWFSIGNKYDTGNSADVEILDNGDIVEVHQGGILNETVYYNYGHQTENGSIWWDTIGEKYDGGYRPNIASLKGGYVLETHVSNSKTNSHLWKNVGFTQNQTINWYSGENQKFEFNDSSNPVSLQLDNGFILTMFDNKKTGTTWNYMSQLLSNIGNGPLGQDYYHRWEGNTYSEFDGENNDVVQLQNGYLLNVHEVHDSDIGLRYVLGRYKYEQSNRVVWWTCRW